ncbi:hypothetical protein COT97_03220 [Candidatus Falkowbacteria bacterium CG10_big_fil_rev_8_21_14_0_10_39_11]|uniref:Uncharacterized protein n=1 Tax=Candidatus Falkowbacteria bacterium CG10_big_fil_rev_8_21_14_0_10_39_11 TaxID=1974565 RepID=A0A2H0V6V8_9BACT|nr:MAG: hypothetical protein COT97_03220 [Candidatus Falkowbacteria bacterium CG10_big_fil_rev_8_21_14_0_10_39_11]
MKHYSQYILVVLIAILALPFFVFADQREELSGRILLQVEQHGEAWYVNPDNGIRYYMGRPYDAFQLMRGFGLGITNENLNKIPIGLIAQSGTDTDKDGLVDLLEEAIKSNKLKIDSDGDTYSDKEEILNGYNPNGDGKFPVLPLDQDLIDRLSGKILLQIEDQGQAWYVSPVNGNRYFLGRPAHAFEIMRGLGLGITDHDIADIPKGSM